MSPKFPGAAITGWGLALPDKVVTNADFEARLDTSDAWIIERTGIRERRFGGTTGGLAAEAARAALAKAGNEASEIDLLVLATTSPDQAVPATSSALQAELGCSGAAFDLNAACSASATSGHSSSGPTPSLGSPTRTTAAPPCCSPTAQEPSSSRPGRTAISCCPTISGSTAH